MNVFLRFCLLMGTIAFHSIYADTIYIIGENNDNRSCFWTILPPESASSFQELDEGGYSDTRSRAVTFAPDQTVYIVGNVTDDEDSIASYWTSTGTGPAGPVTTIGGASSNQPTIYGITYKVSGVGYMVGVNDAGNASYWTISPSGVVSGSTELCPSGYATGIAFAANGTGYIAGADSSFNVSYWTLSSSDILSGPFNLAGGEVGGSASAYATAVSPSGTAYVVGNSTSGFACYWTISPEGVASSANILDGGSNSIAWDIAFLPDGSGIIVGQGTGNVACYWPIATDGSAGDLTLLPNGDGNNSSAYGVAYSSDGTAYMVGSDNAIQSVYWTLPFGSTNVGYHVLDTGGIGIAFDIAIYFPQGPNPPQNLTGKFVRNNFGWTYEYCAVLKWTPSDSSKVVAYNIYRNGILIATVNSTKTKYEDHNQNKTLAEYAVTAIDESGNESTPTTVTFK